MTRHSPPRCRRCPRAPRSPDRARPRVSQPTPAAGSGAAQAAGQPPGDARDLDPAELGRAVRRLRGDAGAGLGLDEARFGPFVTRLRALQKLRRRHLRERAVLMHELRQLLQDAEHDAQVRGTARRARPLERRPLRRRAPRPGRRSTRCSTCVSARASGCSNSSWSWKLELVSRARAAPRANASVSESQRLLHSRQRGCQRPWEGPH